MFQNELSTFFILTGNILFESNVVRMEGLFAEMGKDKLFFELCYLLQYEYWLHTL